ncbi:MAG: LysR family transcriptional regulator [bacterium]|nr:LysR family transcriptional regulator [bacterium]
MELRVLKYFLTTAEEENITKAAKLLHVSQPTLSRQLMQLEEELGVVLFKRSNHNIVLTQEGLLLKRRAKEMLLLADRTKEELSGKDEAISGKVSIGCGELQSVSELAEIITAFGEAYPLVQFQIYSGSSVDIKERIENGTLDLGLLLEPVDITKYDFVRMHTKEEWGILVDKRLPISKKEVVRPEDLVGLPLMISSSNPIKNELSSWFGDYAGQLNVVSTYNLMYNSAILAEKRAGALLCLRLEARYENLVFIPLAPRLTLSSVLAWKERQTFSKATAAFIQFAREMQKLNDKK